MNGPFPFNVGLEYFFSQDKARCPLAIVRKRQRKRFPEHPDTKDLSYYVESLDFPVKDPKLSAYIADFCPLAEKKQRPHQHAGVEFIRVLRGRLDLKVENEQHTLNGGDSIYFDSSVMHSYRLLGRRACTAIVVTAR